VQFRHLLQVAQRVSLARELLDVLRRDVVVAAMGTTCRAILQLHGVPVRVMPEVPKMGPLVRSLMLYLEHATPLPAPSPSLEPLVH
jgi:hypothetical protein